MSETWTPAVSSSETWTNKTQELHIFSPSVFSHVTFGGKRVFALGSSSGGAEFWDSATGQSETWTPV